jgi:hypothetical protein
MFWRGTNKSYAFKSTSLLLWPHFGNNTRICPYPVSTVRLKFQRFGSEFNLGVITFVQSSPVVLCWVQWLYEWRWREISVRKREWMQMKIFWWVQNHVSHTSGFELSWHKFLKRKFVRCALCAILFESDNTVSNKLISLIENALCNDSLPAILYGFHVWCNCPRCIHHSFLLKMNWRRNASTWFRLQAGPKKLSLRTAATLALGSAQSWKW